MTESLKKMTAIAIFLLVLTRTAQAQTNLPPEPSFPPIPAGAVQGKSDSIQTKKAKLVVRTAPPGASVFLNGILLGQTPFALLVNVGNNVSMGIQMDGYYSQQYLVNMTAGQTLSLDFSLAKIPDMPKAYVP